MSTPLRRRWYAAALLALLALHAGAALAGRALTDMAGRTVVLADPIGRTAAVGAGPVISSFVAALGAGATLVNGMPVGARLRQTDCCRFLPRVVPGILDLPSVESASFQLNRELLATLRPDVVLLHGETLAREIEATGLRPFVLHLTRDAGPGRSREANAVQVMAALGELYGRQARARDYARHFADVLDRVNARLADAGGRPRAIYFSHRGMALTSMTADWWIEAAGGTSVTRDVPLQNSRAAISLEQLLAWNPEVIFAATPEEAREIAQDVRLSGIAAVRSGRIHAVPRSVIRWAHPSPEQAVGVLWAAARLHPGRFPDTEVTAELRHFYRSFYQIHLSDDEVEDIVRPSLRETAS